MGQRHALIEQAQAGGLPLSVRQLCQILQVNRGWWYTHRAQAEQRAEKPQREEALCQRIKQIREQSAGYGYRRITWALRREGQKINGKRVLQLMREHSWLCQTRHRRRRTTLPGDQSLVAPNLVRGRQASRPQEIWVSDLTYIRLPDRFVDLATFLDVFTRSCVGWQLSESLETPVVLDALQQAISERQPPAGLILHSDRGCQYTSHAYQELASSIQAQVSMSHKGTPSDNAYAESLFGTLKREEVDRVVYSSFEEAQERLERFLQQYNTERLHSSLGYWSPLEFEQSVLPRAAGM